MWGIYLPGSPLVFGPCGGCDGLAAVGAARGKLLYMHLWMFDVLVPLTASINVGLLSSESELQ